MIDLSKVEGSATAAFIKVLPEIENLKNNTDLSESDKIDEAQLIIIQELCKARNNNIGGISQKYIVEVRKNLTRLKRVEDIIKYLNNAINKGKNYEEKGN